MHNSQSDDVLQERDALAEGAVHRQVKRQCEHGTANRTQPRVSTTTCSHKTTPAHVKKLLLGNSAYLLAEKLCKVLNYYVLS